MQVYRLRLLGDYHHSTRIAFVEFVMVRLPLPLTRQPFPHHALYSL